MNKTTNEMFTTEEIGKLTFIAHSHDFMTISIVDDNNFASVLLRLVDFECINRYAEYHEIDQDLVNRCEEYLKEHASNVSIENVGMLGLITGAYDKYVEKNET